MSSMAVWVWSIVQLAIGFHLIMPLLLYIIAFFKIRKKPDTLISDAHEADYAIIVTAYVQTDLLPQVVDSILNINYKNYLVYIVADNCDISRLHFNNTKVILLKPPSVLGSNTRSHNYAIAHFLRAHERVTIIDSDNLVHRDYLNELNKYFDQGYEAVQGLRAPKNLNTMLACLDAARDIYYHFYDGKIIFSAGSSATLAGSGMAFSTVLYKHILGIGDVVGAGFDKVVQYQIVKKGLRIAFAEKALVYDGKTTHSDQLIKQRARWINTWFKYFKYGFHLIGKGVANFNWNQTIYGITLLRPPLFIFLILSVVFMLINIWLAPLVGLLWFGSILIFVLCFFNALFLMGTDKRIYSSLLQVPKFMYYQVLSLLKIRKANKYSVSTQHTV